MNDHRTLIRAKIVIQDENLELRIKNVVRRFARFAFLHYSNKIIEFLSEWEQVPTHPSAN